MVSALFPIVNPIGGSPVFLLLTQDYSRESRKLLARRVAMNSFILLIVSMAVGTHILSFFGISLPVVQVGGGLIVVSTGWAMLTRSDQVDRGQVHQTVTTQDVLKNAFYPLTLPLTVGPGSISIAITLGANEPRHLGANVLALISAAIGAALIALTIYLCYGYADRLAAAITAVARQPAGAACRFTIIGAVEEEGSSRGARHLVSRRAPDRASPR